jgi:hypothetical protein
MTVDEQMRAAWASILGELEALEGAIGGLPYREGVDAVRRINTIRDELSALTDREPVGVCPGCDTMILCGDDYVPIVDGDAPAYCPACGKEAIAAQQAECTDNPQGRKAMSDDLFDLGEERHEQCRYGVFAGEAFRIDAATMKETPIVLPLCAWQIPRPCPPGAARVWGGDAVEFDRDCAVCDAYSPMGDDEEPPIRVGESKRIPLTRRPPDAQGSE